MVEVEGDAIAFKKSEVLVVEVRAWLVAFDGAGAAEEVCEGCTTVVLCVFETAGDTEFACDRFVWGDSSASNGETNANFALVEGPP